MLRNLGLLLCTVFIFLHCQLPKLNNVCDINSKNYFPQLLLSASNESFFCQNQIINTGDFYSFTDFTFYKSIPVTVAPKLGFKANISIQPALPDGLFVNSETGTLSGTPTALRERSNFQVLRQGVVLGQITIEIRDFAPSLVFGQFGSFTSGASYNNSFGGTSLIPSAGNFTNAKSVATDSSGNVYISAANRVLYYPKGQTTATRVYGQHGLFSCDIANAHTNQTCTPLGALASSTLNTPHGLLLDSESNLYITDTGVNRRVLIYPKDSTVPNRAIGVPDFITPGAGATSQSTLYTPIGLTLDPSGGFYLSDSGDSRVLFFPKDTQLPTEVFGQPDFVSNGVSSTANSLNVNYGIISDSKGGFYVADRGNNRVLYFPKGSKSASRVYGQLDFFDNGIATSAAGLNQPESVALDQSENVYVADYNNNRILIFPNSNQTSGIIAVGVIGQFGSFTCGIDNNGGACNSTTPNSQNIYRPTSVNFDRSGKLYVVDSGNNRVLGY